MNNVIDKASRSSKWDFERATILGNVSDVQSNEHYPQAKNGDIKASLNLVDAFIKQDFIKELMSKHGDKKPMLVSVHGVESLSVNQIPLAMSMFIADKAGWQVDQGVVQMNKVGHTKSSGWHRLAYQALFDGEIAAGRNYIITDDFIGQGGTIANLKGYIETKGGIVIDAIILAGKDYSAKLSLDKATLQELRSKHGELESWWRKQFGFGFDALTESEARYLIRTENADTIRNRLAEAQQGGGG